MSSSAGSLARPETAINPPISERARADVAEPVPPIEGGQATKATGKTARLANVEILRVLAMLEIVRYHDHADRLPLVGGLGLPTFLLLTNTFNCTLTEKRGVKKFLEDKRDRLFLPWVFWSLFYGALLVVTGWRHGQTPGDVLSWEMILAGTSSHLWFVPFAVFSAGLVAAAQLATRKLPHLATAYAAALVGALVLVGIAALPERDWPAPVPQWLLSTPSAFFGFAIGRLVLNSASGKPHVRQLIPIAIVSAIGALIFGLWHHDMLIWRYCVSLLLVFLAFLRPGTSDPVSRFFSPLLFGIYLAHHVIGHRLLVKVPLIEHSQLLFVVDFILTALLVRALKSTPLKRFV